jgi:hypothetical protein
LFGILFLVYFHIFVMAMVAGMLGLSFIATGVTRMCVCLQVAAKRNLREARSDCGALQLLAAVERFVGSGQDVQVLPPAGSKQKEVRGVRWSRVGCRVWCSRGVVVLGKCRWHNSSSDVDAIHMLSWQRSAPLVQGDERHWGLRELVRLFLRAVHMHIM